MSFISEIATHAQRIKKEYNILASLVIAQACLESNFGKSGLAVKGKNLFGIKGSYNGQSVTMLTTEYRNGKPYKVNAAFRRYPSWYESLCDLANLYTNGVSWDRNHYKPVIGETDYKKACKAVQSCGYATDPNYANKLIKIIEENKLMEFDGKGNVEPNVVSKPGSVKTYKVVNSIGAYINAADAKSKKNRKGTVKASTYFVFNESQGMINVTSKKGVAGSWINPAENKVKSASQSKYHVVVKGDTVSELALKYGSSQKDIKKWNKLNNKYLIKIGQKLRVK